jgi:hypothetical protein
MPIRASVRTKRARSDRAFAAGSLLHAAGRYRGVPVESQSDWPLLRRQGACKPFVKLSRLRHCHTLGGVVTHFDLKPRAIHSDFCRNASASERVILEARFKNQGCDHIESILSHDDRYSMSVEPSTPRANGFVLMSVTVRQLGWTSRQRDCCASTVKATLARALKQPPAPSEAEIIGGR